MDADSMTITPDGGGSSGSFDGATRYNINTVFTTGLLPNDSGPRSKLLLAEKQGREQFLTTLEGIMYEFAKQESSKALELASNTCTWCGRTVPRKLPQCAGCNKATYCNEKCQMLGWSTHRVVCDAVTFKNSDEQRRRNDDEHDEVIDMTQLSAPPPLIQSVIGKFRIHDALLDVINSLNPQTRLFPICAFNNDGTTIEAIVIARNWPQLMNVISTEKDAQMMLAGNIPLLHVVLARGATPAVIHHLLTLNVPVNTQDEWGGTPLLLALTSPFSSDNHDPRDRAEIVFQLLNAGANPTTCFKTQGHVSPLIYFFLRDPLASNISLDTSVLHALLWYPLNPNFATTHHDVRNLTAIAALCRFYRQEEDTQYCTALEMLIEAGAIPSMGTFNGMSCLDCALQVGASNRFVSLLLVYRTALPPPVFVHQRRRCELLQQHCIAKNLRVWNLDALSRLDFVHVERLIQERHLHRYVPPGGHVTKNVYVNIISMAQKCSYCGRESPFMLGCSACLVGFYCNTLCQAQHWSVHYQDQGCGQGEVVDGDAS